MAIDTPRNHPGEANSSSSDELVTPRFDLGPYARSMSTGEIRAAVASESDDTRDCATRMFRHFNADDYLYALDAAEELLAKNPRHALANACASECRTRIEREFSALVRPRAIPRVVAGGAQVVGAGLDHREGFLLALIDGCLTIEALTDVSAMSSFDVLRGMAKLMRLGIIELR